MRPVQFFSEEYLERCKRMTPEQILRFLDEFRRLQAPARPPGTRLVPVEVPEDLLQAFRDKAREHGVPFQTQLERLMQQWIDREP